MEYLLHFGIKLIIIQHGAKNFLGICGGWSGIGVFLLLRASVTSRKGLALRVGSVGLGLEA
jgi:hypothetical protein